MDATKEPAPCTATHNGQPCKNWGMSKLGGRCYFHNPRGRTVILVALVVEGDSEHASEVVEAMLDNGAIQDPINSCAADNGCGHLRVVVARQITPTPEQVSAGLDDADEADEAAARP